METFKHPPARMTAAEFRAYAAGRREDSRPPRRRASTAPAGPVQTKPFRLVLPFLPPSVNRLFTTVRDIETGIIKRVLTTHARRVRKLVAAMVDARLDPAARYELSIDIYLRTHTRAGKVRRIDLTNRVKFLEDCVCDAVGIDDSHVFRVKLQKHDAEEESTVISLTPIQA
jgi:Holliday junction resolvase RusA-like endonuclease